MARKVYIQDRDLFAGGNRAALAVIGASSEFRSVRALMDHDRLEDVDRVTARDEAYGNIPKVVDGRVGLRNVKGYKGSKRKLLREMPWASIAVLTPVGGFARADLTGELRWLMQALIAASSPFASSGHYRSSFRYVVGASAQRGIPRGNQWTIAGVTNVAAYASALENMRSKQVFRRVFSKLQTRSRKKNYDVRLTYLLNTTEISGKGISYPAPVIQIGQLNSMRGRTGLQFRKRPVGRTWIPKGWRRRPWPR